MSTPITNPPKGLVSLLGLRDLGGVPRVLLGDMQAGVDVTQFLLVDRECIFMSPNPQVSAVGAAAAFTVPAGELWYVHEFGIRSAPLLAGERIQMTTLATTLSATGGGASCPNGTIGTATNVGARTACHIRQSFWLNPGSTLTWQVLDIATAGTIEISPIAIITRLRV
jgi:hypothetical protein